LELKFCKEQVDKNQELIAAELRGRLTESYDFFNNLSTQVSEENSDKFRRVGEDLRRLQAGLSSEASVRMLDIENVFGRLNMMKEEFQAQVESEKRQRMLGEDKVNTEQTQMRKLVATVASPRSATRGYMEESSLTGIASGLTGLTADSSGLLNNPFLSDSSGLLGGGGDTTFNTGGYQTGRSNAAETSSGNNNSFSANKGISSGSGRICSPLLQTRIAAQTLLPLGSKPDGSKKDTE